jgi:hypothetical protein
MLPVSDAMLCGRYAFRLILHLFVKDVGQELQPIGLDVSDIL